jgi:Transposase DDE domain
MGVVRDDKCRSRLDDGARPARGGGLYRRHRAMVEPVFAQTKHNRRINQFERRGRSAAHSESRLITATHNLMKLHKHHLAAQAA